jgi:hypothetical protein
MSNKADKARELAEFQAEEAFHRREWLVQRIAWGLLILVIAAGLAGSFGSGPLSKRAMATASGTIEIDRFARRHASGEWRIQPIQSAAEGSQLALRISSSFLERYEIAAIVPEPASMTIDGSDVVFVFDAADARGTVAFHVEPENVGLGEGSFVLNDSEPLLIQQFVYP